MPRDGQTCASFPTDVWQTAALATTPSDTQLLRKGEKLVFQQKPAATRVHHRKHIQPVWIRVLAATEETEAVDVVPGNTVRFVDDVTIVDVTAVIVVILVVDAVHEIAVDDFVFVRQCACGHQKSFITERQSVCHS